MHVAVIPGDGTGPEVTAEAMKALGAVVERFDLDIDLEYYDIGGERYKRTGEVLPDAIVEEIGRADAVFLGAIGHPDVKPGILERGIILRLRREFDQYINLRPVKLYPGVETPIKGKGPEDIDFVVVRENTEGLYAGAGGFSAKGTEREVAVETSINTRHAVERCVRYAFELSETRPEKHVTFCGKTNVLVHSHDLWYRVFSEVAAEYPGVAADYANVDALCLWLVDAPERFDVIVTENMFGDIITDLGAVLQGGLGIAAGANLNPEGISMFEPIGGSAPKYTGTGKINPLAAIVAAAFLLQHTGHPEAGAALEAAVAEVAGSLDSMRAGRMGASTSEVGDRVVAAVSAAGPQ